MPLRPSGESKESTLEELKQRIHGKLVDKLDLTKVGELEGEILRREIRLVVEHLCDSEDTLLNRADESSWSPRYWTRRSAWDRWSFC